ncbi:MAG: GGDEF domain-containing protein [Gammaproteobacteria bacterium]
MLTGLLFDGVAGSEHVDSSGEKLTVKLADCSAWDGVDGMYLNWEHEGKEKGAHTVVGKVVFLKKIYSKEDCDNERERKYWDQVELPFIYIIGRLFDGAGHAGAKAIAAIMRDNTANNEPLMCRLSVEGNTLLKEGNIIKDCLVRAIAITIRPCNKMSSTELIADPAAPEGFKKDLVPKKDFPELDTLKFENPEFSVLYSSDTELNIINNAILTKAIEAGGGNAAPDSLVGGSALVKEDFGPKKSVKERVKEVMEKNWGDKFDKSEVRKLIKFILPEISDSYIDHFENAIEDLHLKRNSVKKSENEFNIINFHNLEINLKKTIDDLKISSITDTHMPVIYALYYKVDGKEYRAGRFMLYDNKLTHLEDYHGMLDRFLPEGPLTVDLVSQIYNLRDGPHTKIQNEPIPLGIDPEKEKEADIEADKHNGPQRPASVFDYMRIGMDKPHVIEVKDGVYYLDGNKLSQPEIDTIYNNLRDRNASLRYKEQLSKAENESDLDPGSALTHVRNAVAAGHIHPDVERALTRHIYSDPMTGMGNKYSHNEFRKQNKPGVHVALDGTDFSAINNAFGHDTGDQAIKTMAEHIKGAADEAAPGANKTHRFGGDEFSIFLPTYEHAAKFARSLHQRLENTPPINGVHKVSMGMGFGHNHEMADKALSLAKEQKYLPGQESKPHRERKRAYPIGQAPNMTHSLIEGKSGPIPIHDPTPEAIKQSIPETPKSDQKAA